jgi:hypothetical protein
MTLVKKDAEYIETPVRKPSKEGIKVIDCMPTHRIIAYVAGRHKYGLSLTVNFLIIGCYTYDKLRWFL